jgi:hypothetical protein
MQPFILAPSIIALNFTHLTDEIAVCESAGAFLIQLPAWIAKSRPSHVKTLR